MKDFWFMTAYGIKSLYCIRKVIVCILLLVLGMNSLKSQGYEESVVRVPIQFPGSDEVQILDVILRNGSVFLDGDIYLGSARKLRITEHGRSASLSPIAAAGSLWPDNIVPFNLSNSHPEATNILRAMTHISSRTSITFVRRTNETNFLSFSSKDDGCYSNIGMVGGEQFINMSGTCGYGAAIHELGHALGLFHEQARTDRDEYVRINWDNIISGKEFNFQRYVERGRAGIDFDIYDYKSIMHYSPNAFSVNGQPTISVLSPPAPPGTTIGSGSALSKVDILSINNMYRILPRSTSVNNLGDEIATTPNPPCTGMSTNLSLMISPGVDTIDNQYFRFALHEVRSGAVVETIGNSFKLDPGTNAAEVESMIESNAGDYLLALWESDEEGTLIQLVNDGFYYNGRRIEIVNDCSGSTPDQYEFNNQEVAPFESTLTDQDSNFIFTSDLANIHSIQDIDYYHFELPEHVNFSLTVDVDDDVDDEEVYTNDVVFDYKLEGSEWQGYNDRRLTVDQLLNGRDVSFRVRSHFPDDTGSYQLNVNLMIDPQAMLEVDQERFTIDANDTMYAIPISSNRIWKVVNEADWIYGYSEEGFGFDTLYILSLKNPDFEDRETEVKLINEESGVEESFKLKQNGVVRTLSTDYAQVPACNDEGNVAFYVYSNSPWTVTTETSWINLITTEGELDAPVLIQLSKNITRNTRSGTIRLSIEGSSRTVTINQAGTQSNDACLSPIYVEVPAEAGTIAIDVNTAFEWDVLNPSEEISGFTPAKGSGAGVIEISYPELPEELDDRFHKIDVAVQNIGVYTVVILQTRDFSSSTSEVDGLSLFRYNNPADDLLTINIEVSEKIEDAWIALSRIDGSLLWRQPINLQGTNFTIEKDISELIPGMYLLSIGSRDQISTSKLIKY